MKGPMMNILSLFIFTSFFYFFLGRQAKLVSAQDGGVDVGVVLDFESSAGKKDWASISMAVEDFNAAAGGNGTGRVVLHGRDSRGDIVGAASAALNLLKNVKARAIIGPMTSAQTKFVADLCNRSQVPIVSFSATSPSLSSAGTPFFVRATLNDSSQVAAVAALVSLHGWREAAPVYEDTDYGSGIVPFLIDEFTSVGVRVPYRSVVPPNASDEWLDAELYKLMSMQTRVFVVHMMADLGSRLFQRVFDAVVGDTTIIANRSLYIDFTLPYTESGVSMIVPVKEDKSKNTWIFLKPLTTDLWLASLAFFFFTGFVVWVIEHRINMEFRGPPLQQMGTIFYFAFSTLVFAHKERLESNLSRFAVIIWVSFVLIITSSYTASLTSMLTVQQLQPAVTDLSELIKNSDHIGYQNGSFVAELLKQQLKFNENKLKSYNRPEEYAEALARGSKNGGVAAIFDEIPYLKLFMSEHCQNYTMVGRTYKADGFGFVFPRGSPLVSDVSRAILNVTEGDSMAAIEKKWFGDQTTCPSDTSSVTSSSLNFRSFGGLFLITGCVSSLALLIFLVTFLYREWGELKITAPQNSIWTKIKEWARYYDTKDLSSHTFKDYAAATTPNVGSQSPLSVNLSDLNFGSPVEGIRSFRERGEEVIGQAEEDEDAEEMVEINLQT